MRRVVISTVGTSLLNHQINRANPDERNWSSQLLNSTNKGESEIEQEEKDIVHKLRERASKKLAQNEVAIIRRNSAELNGLYGLYENQLAQGKQDMNFLIATDTYQCQTTAEVVRDFLQKQGLSVDIKKPTGLSTASTENFSSGIDELISWLREEIIPGYKESHKICFNLVGSFKSLQGYLNTIGMFYADEILYIFESENADLITIPRLPITLDCKAIKPYAVDLALMDAGLDMPVKEEIPESLVLKVDEEMTLSTWGKLVWGECKKSLLAWELLKFPRLLFEDSFREDYKQIACLEDKIKLQETLASVAYLLEKNQGNTIALKQHPGLQYDNYTNKSIHGQPIGHFRVTQSLRVSSIAENGVLHLRKYGREPIVNKNP